MSSWPTSHPCLSQLKNEPIVLDLTSFTLSVINFHSYIITFPQHTTHFMLHFSTSSLIHVAILGRLVLVNYHGVHLVVDLWG